MKASQRIKREIIDQCIQIKQQTVKCQILKERKEKAIEDHRKYANEEQSERERLSNMDYELRKLIDKL